MTTEFTNIAQTAKITKSVSFGVSSLPCDRDKFNTSHKALIMPSQVSGQTLAGSGALVFEGELLEIPTWN